MTYITKTTVDTGSMTFETYDEFSDFRMSLPAFSALSHIATYLNTEGVITNSVCIQQSNRLFEVFVTYTSKEALDAVMTTPEVLAGLEDIDSARSALGWTSTTIEVTESPAP